MRPNLALLLVLAIIGVVAMVSIFLWKKLAVSRIKWYRENMELRQEARTATTVPGSTQKSASNATHVSPVHGRVRFYDRSGEPSNISAENTTTVASDASVVPAPRKTDQSPASRGPRAPGSPWKTGKSEGVTITLDHKPMEDFLRHPSLKWNKTASVKASPTKVSADMESSLRESPVKASTTKATPSKEPAAKQSPVRTSATKESPTKKSMAKETPVKASPIKDSAKKPASIKLSPVKASTTATQAKTSRTKASATKQPPSNASSTKQSLVKFSAAKEPATKKSPIKASSSQQDLVKLSGKQVISAEQPKPSPAPASPTKSKQSSSDGGMIGFAGLELFGGENYDARH